MNKKKQILLYILLAIPLITLSQKDSLDLEKIRVQSGVDPTRINTKLAYSIWYYDRSDNRSLINNRIKFTAGIQKWGLSLKYEVATLNSGIAGEGFKTRGADLELNITNTLYLKKKHAVAVGLGINLPTGALGFGSQYFSINPSMTYAYTINPSLILATQPQYTFHIAKDNTFPDLSVLTIRTFIAKFQKSGWFYVFEPRIIHDFADDNFNLILSPIIGKSIGSGFNLGVVLEFPTKQETIDNRGILIQTGITKNF
ncbi:MAG: transporter [Bacteroidota bacterium]